ncbi:Sec1-like protein, partial [Gorgonomyces haynaldii]
TAMTTSLLTEFTKKDLIRVLDAVRGKKGLVIDTTCSGPLSLVAEFTLLKEHGTEKVYHLEDRVFETECKSLLYMTRPVIEQMKWIANQVRHHPEIEHHVYFVPKRTLICERVLEEEGVLGDLHLGEFYLDLIQLESDVYSLETNNSFKSIYIDGDPTVLNSLGQAIMKLQILTGFIPKVLGKGDHAKFLFNSLLKYRNQFLVDNGKDTLIQPEFDSMILLDRNVDLLSLMRTQLTYEGLIDEIFGIHSSFVELEPSFFSNQQATSAKAKKVLLNGQDQVFQQLRDHSFEMVGDVLSEIALRLQSEEDQRHQAKTAPQLKEFAAKLGGLQQQRQSLSVHQKIYDYMLKYCGSPVTDRLWKTEEQIATRQTDAQFFDYIDDLISRNTNYQIVLRQLALYSLTLGGIKSKNYDQIRLDMAQAYGYQHILTFQNMEKAGLIKKSDGTKSPYGGIMRGLRLINDYHSSLNNQDISYIFAGFAPISVRLVQFATTHLDPKQENPPKASWKGHEEVLKLLPGDLFEETIPTKGEKGFRKNQADQTPSTLVVFIGGCTLAEISALRTLGTLSGRKYCILTTGITSGNKLINQLS